MAHHLIAQIFVIFFFQSETVVFLLLVPVLQTNDQINILGILNTGDTEQCLHINDSDTTLFDKVFGDIRCGSNKRLITDLADLNSIICNQTMSSLDQFQRRLGLTDAALTGDQDTLAVDIHQ